MKTEYTLNVRYSECDQGGVVHHAIYPVWYEEARMDFFEKAGMPFRELDACGILPPLVDLHVQFRAPVRYPEQVRIETFISGYSPKKIELTYRLYSGGMLANEATTLIVWTTKESLRTLDMEKSFPEFYSRISAAAETNVFEK